MEAIERIKGFCCEVTEAQWKELVRVADEVGLAHGHSYADNRNADVTEFDFAQLDEDELVCLSMNFGEKVIPYPDFLAKLKGEEKWEPKAGEMVEVGGGYEREYIAQRGGKHFCWGEKGDSVSSWLTVKPVRQTITRAEAESLLNKRIID
jgi:hypothetical protein